MYFSDNNNFATWQHGQESDPILIFSLGSLAPRSLALEVFKSRILLLLQLPQQGIVAFHDYEVPVNQEVNRSEVNWLLFVNNGLVCQQHAFSPRLLKCLSATQYRGCQSGANRNNTSISTC